MYLIIEKLKREWKTFALAVVTTVAGAWQMAVEMGADLPNLFSWVPEAYRSAVLFLVGTGFLLLRKYTPTTVVQAPETPVEPEATVTPKV